MIRGSKRHLTVGGKRRGTTNIGTCVVRVGRSGSLILRQHRTGVLMLVVPGVMRIRVMRSRGTGVNRHCVMMMKARRNGDRRQGLPRQHQDQQDDRELAYTHRHTREV